MAVANSSIQMDAEQAAWVRTHVWTRDMRAQYTASPGHVTRCACQYGPSGWCAAGRCANCQRPDPALIAWETVICDRTGVTPMHLPGPYEHPTPGLNGPRRERLAMVWLADRTCRWRCPCSCHTTKPAYEPVMLPGMESLRPSRSSGGLW